MAGDEKMKKNETGPWAKPKDVICGWEVFNQKNLQLEGGLFVSIGEICGWAGAWIVHLIENRGQIIVIFDPN